MNLLWLIAIIPGSILVLVGILFAIVRMVKDTQWKARLESLNPSQRLNRATKALERYEAEMVEDARAAGTIKYGDTDSNDENTLPGKFNLIGVPTTQRDTGTVPDRQVNLSRITFQKGDRVVVSSFPNIPSINEIKNKTRYRPVHGPDGSIEYLKRWQTSDGGRFNTKHDPTILAPYHFLIRSTKKTIHSRKARKN